MDIVCMTSYPLRGNMRCRKFLLTAQPNLGVVDMEVGKNIQRERERKGLSRAMLAKAMGKDVSTVFRWEKGDRNPSAQDLEDIANALDITASELLSDGNVITYDSWTKVPVLSSEREICKLFVTGANIVDMLEVEFYMVLPNSIIGESPEEAFGVRAHGDGMSPEVPDGAICLVNATEPVADGDVALVIVNGAVQIKRVYREPGGTLELRPDNPEFPAKTYGEKDLASGWVKVIGKVNAVISIPKRKA